MKYRVDRDETNDAGQLLGYADWRYGPSLSRIKGALVYDPGNGKHYDPETYVAPRLTGTVTAYITGEPDTFFSIPARARYRGKWYKGWVTTKEHFEDDWWHYPVWAFVSEDLANVQEEAA